MRPLLLAAGLLCACARDLTLPDLGASAPGTVFGRAVWAAPGASEPQPAAGAVISLSASSLSVIAGSDGRFNVEGITRSGGTLLLQLDSDADGTFDRQRGLSLAEVGAGPGRNINLGDVVVGESARVHGLVLRGDLKLSGGQAGTQVFVPLTSFVSYSASDGLYGLAHLPAGTADLGFFRAGYLPATLTGLALQPGEDFSVSEVDLVRDDGTHSGTLSGTVTTAPVADSAAGTTVTATNASTGATSVAQTDGSGAFTLGSLPVGLYDVRAERAGYTSMLAPGVLLFPSQTTTLALALGQGAAADGGRPPAPDAGPVVACTSTQDCPPGQWCDGDVCAPFCGATSGCSGGRVCEATSHTCVAPCTTTCPSGQVCDSAARICRSVCDGDSLPCSQGFKCVANACVPQCAVDADCASGHQVCQGGACVPDGTCGTDLDCLATQICAGTLCATRRDAGMTLDGGWTCAGPCDCRLGEVCFDGVCQPDVVPTLVLDGGPLDTVLRSAKSGDVIALAAGSAYWANEGFTLDAGAVTLSGGYVECGTARWIFDPSQTTTLSSDGGTVLRVIGTTSAPLSDVALRGLTFAALAPASASTFGALDISAATRLKLTHVAGGLSGTLNGGVNHAVFRVADSTDVDLEQLKLLGTAFSGQTVGLWLQRSAGSVSGFVSPAFTSTLPFTAVLIDAQTGPVQLDTLELGPSTSAATSFVAQQCGDQPLSLTSSKIAISVPTGISLTGCANVELADLFIDGSKSSSGSMTAVATASSAGTVSRTHLLLPAMFTNGTGYSFKGNGGPWTLSDDTIDGCGASGTGYAVYLNNGGTVTLDHVSLGGGDAGTFGGNCAIEAVRGDTSGNTIAVKDSTLVVPAVTANAATLDLFNSNLLVERSVIIGGVPLTTSGSQVEAYSSFFFSRGNGAISQYGGQLYLVGNTVDGSGPGTTSTTYGVYCNSTPVGFMSSNLINGGAGTSAHYIFEDGNTGASCFLPANTDHNYLYYSGPGGRTAGDKAPGVLDGGVGNILGDNVACYPLNLINPSYHLAAGSPCVDRGPAQLQRRDSSPLTLDVESRARVSGGAADIGAWEL